MTILGFAALFFISPTSTIDIIESNVAVRNIRLYYWGAGNDTPPLLMPLTKTCINIPTMTGPTEVPIK